MIARIKNVFKKWRADKQQLRELLISLEALTDSTYLERASFYDGTCTASEAIDLKFKGIV